MNACDQIPISFEASREAGKAASESCTAKALRSDPTFVQKAQQAILAHLRVVGSASGETLVDIAIASGARCKDARAFGSVFAGLAHKKLIWCVRSDLPRARGHGTSGGKLWAIGR